MSEPDPPPGSLKIIVDPTLPADEVHVHPSAFDKLQTAFMKAASWDWRRIGLPTEPSQTIAGGFNWSLDNLS